MGDMRGPDRECLSNGKASIVGDLISHRSDRKRCAMIAGKTERASEYARDRIDMRTAGILISGM
jgi:hypothetical protein